MQRNIAHNLAMIATLIFVMVMCFALAHRLEVKDRTNTCTTDTECAQMYGGNGDPIPAR